LKRRRRIRRDRGHALKEKRQREGALVWMDRGRRRKYTLRDEIFILSVIPA